MAARTLRPRHQDEIRAKIQTSQLVNRLTDCAVGKIELRPDQIKSIEILLRKSMPDLSAIEHSGDVSINHIARIPEPAKDAEKWVEQHTPPQLEQTIQ